MGYVMIIGECVVDVEKENMQRMNFVTYLFYLFFKLDDFLGLS